MPHKSTYPVHLDSKSANSDSKSANLDSKSAHPDSKFTNLDSKPVPCLTQTARTPSDSPALPCRLGRCGAWRQ